jgi:hypothetical protein
MEQKRKERPSVVALLETIFRMLVPEYIVGYFDIYEAKESKTS